MTTKQGKVPKPKLELPELARQLDFISLDCQTMGKSLDSACQHKVP